MGHLVRDWIRSRTDTTRAARARDPLPDAVHLALRDAAAQVYRDMPWVERAIAPYRRPERFHGVHLDGNVTPPSTLRYLARRVECADCGRRFRVDTIKKHRRRKHAAA